MRRAANTNTALPKPLQLVSEVVFGRHNETVAVRTWNTTTFPVQVAIADVTGQHISKAYLTANDAAKLEDALRSSRYKRRALVAGESITNAEG